VDYGSNNSGPTYNKHCHILRDVIQIKSVFSLFLNTNRIPGRDKFDCWTAHIFSDKYASRLLSAGTAGLRLDFPFQSCHGRQQKPSGSVFAIQVFDARAFGAIIAAPVVEPYDVAAIAAKAISERGAAFWSDRKQIHSRISPYLKPKSNSVLGATLLRTACNNLGIIHLPDIDDLELRKRRLSPGHTTRGCRY
jgi:hypothetical protein